jgi:hypothetical protein
MALHCIYKRNPQKLRKVQQSVIKDKNDNAKRAPILIYVITKKTYSDNGNFHDLGGAITNLFLEAFNQGLIMKWVALINLLISDVLMKKLCQGKQNLGRI